MEHEEVWVFSLAALITAAYIAARIAGVVMTMPVFTAKGIPSTVKIMITGDDGFSRDHENCCSARY